jgi:hypothetical protein
MTRGLKRPCLTCTALTSSPVRCPRCAAAHRAEHRRARAAYAPLVARGVRCSRCSEYIDPAEPWDIGRGPAGWRPEHRACNRGARDRDVRIF